MIHMLSRGFVSAWKFRQKLISQTLDFSRFIGFTGIRKDETKHKSIGIDNINQTYNNNKAGDNCALSTFAKNKWITIINRITFFLMGGSFSRELSESVHMISSWKTIKFFLNWRIGTFRFFPFSPTYFLLRVSWNVCFTVLNISNYLHSVKLTFTMLNKLLFFHKFHKFRAFYYILASFSKPQQKTVSVC